MLNVRNVIANIYKSDILRFRVAQILFIAAISFGWFIADGYRRGLFLLAILLLNKSQRKISVICHWKGLTGVTGTLLVTLFLWVTLVPLFSGMEPLPDRIEGMARPIEVFLYGVGIMIFAKDKFFEKYLSSFSVASAVFVSVFAFSRRAVLSFSVIRDDWVFGMHAALAGLIIASLLPWLLYAICEKKKTPLRKGFYIIITMVALGAIFVTYYRTIWIAVTVQLLFAIPLSYYCFNANPLNHKRLLVVLILFIAAVVGYSYHTSFIIRDRFDRLMSAGCDFKNFTNNRGEIWKDAMSLISKRKLGGYGWVSYDDFAVIKMHHPHSSYLDAAFHAGIPAGILYGMVFIASFLLALRYILTKTGPASIAYVVFLMLLATAVGGLTEAFFYESREYVVPFWSMTSLLVSPLYLKKEG
ncbi:O-antigen ligase family protein [Cloacibacillus porcorum]